MSRPKWNRRAKRRLDADDKPPGTPVEGSGCQYNIKRVRPRKRRPRHPGYTITPEHRLWIFENNEKPKY